MTYSEKYDVIESKMREMVNNSSIRELFDNVDDNRCAIIDMVNDFGSELSKLFDNIIISDCTDSAHGSFYLGICFGEGEYDEDYECYDEVIELTQIRISTHKSTGSGYNHSLECLYPNIDIVIN